MIVFDTKGDFYQEFYRPGDIVISNDPTATGSDRKDYWNIFNEIYGGEHMMEGIIEISKSLFAEACEKTNQIFFPNAARDLFMAAVTHFIRSRPARERTNRHLIDYINSTPTAQFRAMLEGYEDFRAMTSYIAKDDSGQTQGVMSELLQITRNIFLGNFAKNGTLGMRNLVYQKGGRIVFIEYDLSIGMMLSPVYTLLFDQAIKEALCRERSPGNVYFITDEFRLLPNLQHIDDAVNFGRSMGVKFMVGLQNIEQMYEVYGQARARSILSGFLTSICFRVNDHTSVEYVQQLHGRNRKKEVYMAAVQGRGHCGERPGRQCGGGLGHSAAEDRRGHHRPAREGTLPLPVPASQVKGERTWICKRRPVIRVLNALMACLGVAAGGLVICGLLLACVPTPTPTEGDVDAGRPAGAESSEGMDADQSSEIGTSNEDQHLLEKYEEDIASGAATAETYLELAEYWMDRGDADRAERVLRQGLEDTGGDTDIGKALEELTGEPVAGAASSRELRRDTYDEAGGSAVVPRVPIR